MSISEFLELHSSYETRNPDEREYAENVENYRRVRWLQAHDSLDGYKPTREFPCPGSLRVIDIGGHHRTVVCDVCRFTTTAPVASAATGSNGGGEW